METQVVTLTGGETVDLSSMFSTVLGGYPVEFPTRGVVWERHPWAWVAHDGSGHRREADTWAEAQRRLSMMPRVPPESRTWVFFGDPPKAPRKARKRKGKRK